MEKSRFFTSNAPTAAASSRAPYILSLALLVAAFLLVGSSRDDLLSLLVWRPLSMVALALAVACYWGEAWRNTRALFLWALAIVVLTALHLVPLPPAVWSALPGRELVVAVYRDAGMALPWQPLSMVQARTWNALFSMAAPLALLIAASNLDEHWHRKLLTALLVVGFASGIIGFIQAIGPAKGLLYFYRITNNGLSVGLFANRNHQAALLASMYPLLAASLTLAKGKPEQLLFRRWLVIAGALLLVPLILMTGSRAGFVLAFIGMLSAFWVYRAPVTRLRPADRQNERRTRMISYGLVAALLVVVSIVVARTPALERLTGTDPASELRLLAFPTIMEATGRFFPFGSGIGTFVEAYQIFEPDSLISASYFNHAHNDFAELVMTAGLPAILLLIWIAVLAFYSLRSLIRNRSIPAGGRGFSAQVLGRAGFSILTMLALSSAADYPLRIPSLTLLGIIAAVWCSAAYRSAQK